MNPNRRLTRSNTDRIIAGVAGGIANYLDVDPTLVRLVFVLLTFAGAISPWIYIILWAILPGEHSVNQSFSQQVRENIAEIEQRATQVAHQVSSQVSQLIGNEQTREVNQSTSSPSNQQDQREGPATGSTRRL